MAKQSVSAGSKSRSRAAKKPRPDFPLYLHKGSGQWSKKVRGRTHYFGTDPAEAEREWDRVKDDLRAGREPEPISPTDDQLTVRWLCNSFMDAKQQRFDAGKIRSRETINDYHKVVTRFADKVGADTPLSRIKPALLERYAHDLPKTWNVTSRNNHLRMLRIVMKWGNDSDELERPIKYARALELYTETQADQDERHASQLSIDEVHRLISAANQRGSADLVAAIWLGVNCGFSTSDIAALRIDHLDLGADWVAMPRTKNGNRRKAWLFPETVRALRKQIAKRPSPSRPELDDLVFLTRHGLPVQQDGSKNRPMTAKFRLLKIAAGIHRPGVSQRSCRHLCRTLADSGADANAARLVMGHKIPGVEGLYIDSIADDRVKAVCEHIRQQFLDGKGGAK